MIYFWDLYTRIHASHMLHSTWLGGYDSNVFVYSPRERAFTVFHVTTAAAINAQRCLLTSPQRPAPARVSRQSQQTLMSPWSLLTKCTFSQTAIKLLPSRSPCSYWTHSSALVKDVDRNLLRTPRGLCFSDIVLDLPPAKPPPGWNMDASAGNEQPWWEHKDDNDEVSPKWWQEGGGRLEL